MPTLNDSLRNATVQDTTDAALQDITGNNPVAPLSQSQIIRPVDTKTEWLEKKKREAVTTTGDYVSAAMHQDGFLNGFIANHVGSEMAVDPAYNAYDPKTYEANTDGLPDTLKPEMLKAHSAAHAIYLRSLLDDKIHEQTILGDLGWQGNTVRLLGGLVSPENLGLMAVTAGIGPLVGGGSALARAGKALKLTTEMAEGPAKVAAVARATELLQQAAAEASTGKAVAGSTAGAAGMNAGLEKLRQQYNYEDDPTGVLHAGLVGIGMGAPLAWLGAREMARLRGAAGMELSLLNEIQRRDSIPSVSPEAEANAAKVRDMHQYVAKVADGEHDIVDLKEPHVDMHPTVPPLEGEVMPHDPLLSNRKGIGRGQTIEGELGTAHPALGETKALGEAKALGETKLLPDNRDVPSEDDLLPEGTEYGSVGSAAAAPGATGMGIEPTYMRSGRLDFYATLNKSQNTVVQELAHKLIKDPIAHSAIDAQGWAASDLKKSIQRSIVGPAHVEAHTAMTDAMKKMGVGILDRARFADDFFKTATKLVRGDADVATTHAAIMPELQRAAAAQQGVYKALLDRAKKAGVKGAAAVSDNANYVTRMFNHTKIDELIREHGADPIHTMLANAMPWLAGKTLADRIHSAKGYLSAVRKLEHSHMATDMQLHAHDMNALRDELRRSGLTPDEINQIVDAMFEHKAAAPDTGNAAPLKYRFNLDENASGLLPNGKQIKVHDLFENDMRVLMDKYSNSMAGHIASAETGVGRSRAEFQQWLTLADQEHEANPTRDTKRFAQEKQWLNDLYDHVTGRPMSTQQFNSTDRIANALRGFTRTATLGQLGIAASTELHKGIVMSGLRAALTQLPTFRAAINAVRKGARFTDDLGRDIQHAWGFGTEMAAGHARQHEVTEFTYDKGLTQFENYANKGSHIVDHISGNAFLTPFTRELSTRFQIQKYADMAAGKGPNAAKRARMVANGVDAGNIDPMLRKLNQYTDRQDGRVVGIRWEDWKRDHAHSWDNFQRLIDRDVREAIQDHDIGETMPFMHTTLGKVFAELRTFMFVGHAKTSLKALHYRDAQSLNQLMFGIVTEAMAYSMQTSINFAGNPSELQRRLRSDNIARAVFQRMSLTGVLPSLLGTPAAMLGVPMETSTVNTDNRNLALTPSMQFALRVMKAPVVAGQALNPFSHTVTTQQEMRDLFGAMPLGNTFGVRNLADWFAQQQPKAEIPQAR